MHDEERITYFGETDARNKRVAFGIKAKDRLKHMYVIGKTGMGKSTLLENMAVQDIKNGEGLCFMDPHGKSAELLLEYIPQERIKDVIYFAPFDADYPIAFNVMEDVGADKRHLVTSGLMSAFKKLWVDQWSARMEYILTNTILALLEYPGSTLLGINKMYSDKEYRKKVVDNVTDPAVKSFWVDEYAKYTDRFAAEATPAIQNKIGQFLSNPIVRNVIGQPKSSFDIRKVMDERKILIVNLSKGLVGETNANLLGSMLITKLYLGAMSRADTPEPMLRKLPNFYLFVDEFQSFANESFANILSEARKYKLNLTIAHQYIEQMSEEVRAAVLGNVGTMIVFRVGAFDAQILEKEFAPQFMGQDLVNLGMYQLYLKLMINGVTSPPFSASNLPPIKKPEHSFIPQVIESSRMLYAQPRAIVEEQIRAIHGLGQNRPVLEGEAGNKEERRDKGERHDRPDRPEKREEPPREKKEERKNPFASVKLEPDAGGAFKLVEKKGEGGAADAKAAEDERDVIVPIPRPKPQPEKSQKSGPKGGTPENMQTLRDALSAVLKKPAPPAPAQKAERAEPVPEKHAKEAEEAPKQQEPKRSPTFDDTLTDASSREVPEDVLRKVLSMDDHAS